MHPMIKAVGIEEFQKGLQDLPKYYSEELEGNYKPVGMWFIWYTKDLPAVEAAVITGANISEAYRLWKGGKTAENAVKKALKILTKEV